MNSLPSKLIFSLFMVILIVFALYSNCGPSLDNSGSNIVSGSISPLPTNSIDPSNSLKTSCSHDVLNSDRISIRVMSVDSIPGAFYLKFDRFPSDFNHTSQSLSIWTYSVDSQNNLNNGSLSSFVFQKWSNGVFSNLSTVAPFTNATYQNLIDLMGSSNLPLTSIQEMWGTVALKVLAAGAADTLVTVALYENSTITDKVTTLIPPFESNPNVFKASRPPLLHTFHPLNFMATGTWTEAQYLSEAQKYCF